MSFYFSGKKNFYNGAQFKENMGKGGVFLLILLIIVPAAYSLSLKELISRYIFSASSVQMNVTSFTDYMIDNNGNGVNDTLVVELTSSNQAGNFIFAGNLIDNNGIATNQTNISLSSGTNKINISFDTVLLSQSQFNYSIKVYNSSNALKFRKDNILTQAYTGYEEGFRIVNFSGYSENHALLISFLINSTLNGTFESSIFLKYNDSIIFSKNNFSIINSTNNLTFIFGNETIKKTHYNGKFNISSIKIGRKIIKTTFSTNSYDFRDFAASSYIDAFNDSGLDTDNDGKYDSLRIRTKMQAFADAEYTSTLALYGLFNELIEIKNETKQFNSGRNDFDVFINGSAIYRKKVNGPFTIKTISLYQNGVLVDSLKDAYTTSSYNFNDFDAPPLPDLNVDVKISDGYHYGISNATVNVTITNIGTRHAFNAFNEIFDNNTFLKSNKSLLLKINSSFSYQINFTNFTDFEISSFADPDDLIEELNESNNAQKITIRLNKKPILDSINNITLNETEKITINLSATDQNEDNLSYSVNSSKFSVESSMLYWNTTTMDSGNYSLRAIVSDGYLNDSALFRIIIIDRPEIDSDNDGVNDSVDRLVGDSVNSTTLNATIYVDGSSNLAKIFNRTSSLKILDGNRTIVEFDFDFLNYKLNLTNMSMEKQSGNSTGSIIVRGLKMPDGATKKVYVDKLNNDIRGICIKDEEILSIAEITSSCNSNNEFKVECDGTSQNSYICTYNETLNKYGVEGLKHSGIMQFNYQKPSEESSISSSSSSSGSGSGSGGGGGIACLPDWQCSEWSDCVHGIKTRTCTDNKKCAFPSEKPEEATACIANTDQEQKASNKKITKKEEKIPQNNNSSNGFSSITGKFLEAGKLTPMHSGTIAALIALLIAAALIFNLKFKRKNNP